MYREKYDIHTFPACGNLLEVHVPGLQRTAVRTLSVQFTAQLLGLALVVLQVSSWLIDMKKNEVIVSLYGIYSFIKIH